MLAKTRLGATAGAAIAAMFMALSSVSCKDDKGLPDNPPPVVKGVDLKRYAGRWYEISRYPNGFQKGCVGSRATYTLRPDGKIDVLNECLEKSFDGKLRSARGKAWVVDKETNAKLRVSFFWPFSGDYWIVDLGDGYEYAVVGHPKRKYLWILARRPSIDKSVYEGILSRLEVIGYDTSKLLMTPQREE